MNEYPTTDSAKIVRQALSFEKPDRLPVFDGFWSEFADNWRKVRGQPEDADIEDYFWIDLQVPVADETFFPTQAGEVGRSGADVFVNDGWGRVVRRKPGAYFSEPVERVLNSPSDLDAIVFDPPDLDARYPGFLREVEKQRRKGRAVFVKIGGPFIRTTFFRGEAEFLMDLVSDEPFAAAQVEKVGHHLLQIGLESLKRADAYDFGVWIYDDMCNVSGPMFSPRTFESILLPVYRRMIAALKAAGARWVILHCDGNVAPLLDMLLDAGIDGINPVEYSAGLDVVELMKKYGCKLRYIGGVCNTHILPSGDRRRIRDHVAALVDAGRKGGLVIGTHSIGPDIPLEAYEFYRRLVAEASL